MGQVTPNMAIYIPAAGETNYDAPFAAGMINIDQHDHSGAPNKGVPIATSGIADGSITYNKLNANVVDTTSGLGTHTGGLANQITTTGLLNALATLATTAGILAKNGSAVTARTLTGTANQIAVTNGDGASGNPTFGLASTVVTPSQPAFNAFLTTDAANVTGNGAIYTVICDSATINQPSGSPPYNTTTGVFTAPVAGNYLLIGHIRVKDFAGATGYQLQMTAGAQVFVGDEMVPVATAGGFFAASVMCVAPLSLGATASVAVQIVGLGGNTADVDGDASNAVTYFAGYLLG